jgi:transposase-like protein
VKGNATLSASLTEMEQQIQEAGQQAMRQALKQAIRQQEDHQTSCPRCGGKQRRLEGTVRRAIATTFGRVQIPRRRFRCHGCWHRWCPANSLFSELKGGTVSQPLREAAMLAGASWPYRVASSLLKQLSGAEISAEEIRLLTNQGGKQRAVQKPGGGRASMLLADLGRPISRAGRAADAGGTRWRLGV